MPSNNQTILMQNVADLQTQVAFRNKAIKEMYALWGPIFQWGLLQAECKFGNNVQEFVLRKLKSLGAIEDQLELANALNAELQAQLAAANARQAEIVAELAQLRAEKATALTKKPVRWLVCGEYFMSEESAIQFALGVPGAIVHPLYAAPVPTPATAPDESQLQKAANHQYDKDTLKALYQAWEMLPCCNLMAAIGGAIQDIQAMQSAQEPRS